MERLTATLALRARSIVGRPNVTSEDYKLGIAFIEKFCQDLGLSNGILYRAIEIWHAYIYYEPESVSNQRYGKAAVNIVCILASVEYDDDEAVTAEITTITAYLGGRLLIPSIYDVIQCLRVLDSEYSCSNSRALKIARSMEAKQYDYGRLAAALYLCYEDPYSSHCGEDLDTGEPIYQLSDLDAEKSFIDSLSTNTSHSLTSLQVAVKEPVGAIEAASYTIVLGRGAAGSVKANATRDVALKIQDDFDTFIREVAIMRSLQHPGIATITSFGITEEDGYLFTMPAGTTTLVDILYSLRNNADSVVSMVRHIARALEYLHLHGVLHLDIKPSNIIIRGYNTPQLIDFGISHCYHQPYATKKIDSPVVTYPWRDIRFYDGEMVVDEGVDVWALGVTILDMLAGTPYVLRYSREESGTKAIIENNILTGEAYQHVRHPALKRVLQQIFVRDACRRPSAGQIVRSLS